MDLVISPTLNEIENIDLLVSEIMLKDDFHLLIVDDNSPDGTWQRVQELQKDFDQRLHLLHRKEKPGFRNSYLDGFRWAFEDGRFRHMYTMDADLSHNPDYLPELRQRLQDGSHIVTGSRYVNGGGVRNWTFSRRFLSKNANRFARFVTRLRTRDCTAGFNGMNIAFAKELDFIEIQSGGYAFLIELKHLFWRNNARMSEVPIIFTDRQFGKTKFNSGMIKEAISVCKMLRKKKKNR